MAKKDEQQRDTEKATPKAETEAEATRKNNSRNKLKFPIQAFLGGADPGSLPTHIQAALTLLSPNPIDGVRVPLIKLLNTAHNYIAAPRLTHHVERELRSEHPTQASKMLILAMAVAVANNHVKLMQHLSNPEFLKELREWLGLDKFDIDLRVEGRTIVLDDGKTKENIYTVPQENITIPGKELEDTIKELSSATKDMNDMMTVHAKEIHDWHANADNAIEISNEFLQPSVEKVDQGFIDLKTIADELEEGPLKEKLTSNIEGLEKEKDQILKDAEEQQRGLKPPDEKMKEMIQKSRKEAGLDTVIDTTQKDTLNLQLKGFHFNVANEKKLEDISNTQNVLSSCASDSSLNSTEKLQSLEKTMQDHKNDSSDISSMMSKMPKMAQKQSKITRDKIKPLLDKHENEVQTSNKKIDSLKEKVTDLSSEKTLSLKIDK